MTDRIKGYVVTLEPGIRADDAKKVEEAIGLLWSVVSVRPLVADVDHMMAVEQAKRDIRKRLWAALEAAEKPT